MESELTALLTGLSTRDDVRLKISMLGFFVYRLHEAKVFSSSKVFSKATQNQSWTYNSVYTFEASQSLDTQVMRVEQQWEMRVIRLDASE